MHKCQTHFRYNSRNNTEKKTKYTETSRLMTDKLLIIYLKDVLKQASIDTNNSWKLAGKPRSGPIFDKRDKKSPHCIVNASEIMKLFLLDYTLVRCIFRGFNSRNIRSIHYAHA